MLATKDETLESKEEKIENQEIETSSEEDALSELNEPFWSVVNFEKVLHANLTYDEAVQKMQEAKEQKMSGLCIITNEAAHRLAK